ncbi:MAG: archaellin/type IV pilin N-terminal domain-containing protein [Candidatus Nanoarchaeia archaeon]
MIQTKKGMSELIATVIIIGFAIILAAGVVYWGTSFFKGLQDSTAKNSAISSLCASGLSNFEVKASRATAAGTINIVLDNTKNNADIYGAVVTLKDSDTSVKSDIYATPAATPTAGQPMPPLGITTAAFPTPRPVADPVVIPKFNTRSISAVQGPTPGTLPKKVSVKVFVKVDQTDANEAPSVCGNEFVANVVGA